MHDVTLIAATAIPSLVMGMLVMRAFVVAQHRAMLRYAQPLTLPEMYCQHCGAINPPPALIVDPNATQLCMTCQAPTGAEA